MFARRIEFEDVSLEKASGEAAPRIQVAKADREAELRVVEALQFERGYN